MNERHSPKSSIFSVMATLAVFSLLVACTIFAFSRHESAKTCHYITYERTH